MEFEREEEPRSGAAGSGRSRSPRRRDVGGRESGAVGSSSPEDDLALDGLLEEPKRTKKKPGGRVQSSDVSLLNGIEVISCSVHVRMQAGFLA